MAWIYLFIAGLLETVWAVGIKYCDGFKINPAFMTVLAAMALSMTFLYLAMKEIPIGAAYAAWTGIGIVGVACYGILVLNESASFIRVVCLAVILLGIIGLKLTSD